MSLPVFFEPNIDLDSFKSLLIENGYAERIVYYENGETETIPWTINRLDPTSNLLANIYMLSPLSRHFFPKITN